MPASMPFVWVQPGGGRNSPVAPVWSLQARIIVGPRRNVPRKLLDMLHIEYQQLQPPPTPLPPPLGVVQQRATGIAKVPQHPPQSTQSARPPGGRNGGASGRPPGRRRGTPPNATPNAPTTPLKGGEGGGRPAPAGRRGPARMCDHQGQSTPLPRPTEEEVGGVHRTVITISVVVPGSRGGGGSPAFIFAPEEPRRLPSSLSQ